MNKPKKEYLIEAHNLDFAYPNSQQLILQDISFHLEQGKILGIIGPNGGGKTTLLKILAGLYRPSAGEIRYYGKKNCHQKPSITYLPQRDPGQVLLPLTLEEWIDASTFPRPSPKKEDMKRALERTGLEKALNSLVRELSEGEYQKLLLAKAWLSHDQLILMDEPTKGLDTQGQKHLFSLIKGLCSEKNAGILLVDHNISQVLKHCHRLLCLNRSFHWHDVGENINQDILSKTYACELSSTLKEAGIGHEHK